jgi:hypothetical protein
VLERPVSFAELTLDPDREVLWLRPTGTIDARAKETELGAILDAVVHPSGDVTVLRVSDVAYVIERFDSNGISRAIRPIFDDLVPEDPPALAPSDPWQRVERHTHDAAGLDADGEDVFVATRTGRHSVVAYRVRWDAAPAKLSLRTRTLVVPPHSIGPVALTGGTYDTFGQLAAHYAVRVAVTSDRLGYVAVAHARLDPHSQVRAHAKVFGEALAGDPDALDAYVTRVDVDGARLGTSVIGGAGDDQLYGLRAIGDSAYAVGRSEHWNAQGTGFDAFLARIDHDGRVAFREVDVDRGDVAFDVARDRDGSLVLVGASSYWQNPHGASLSEESLAFARRLHADETTTAIPIANGPRHNEARFVLPLVDGRLWIGGMHDGPGTHSADSDPSALTARGFTKGL